MKTKNDANTAGKHTPGPWSADPSFMSEGGFCIRPHRSEDGGMTGFQIAYIPMEDEAPGVCHALGGTTKGNALLIAAAPDLLAALKDMMVYPEVTTAKGKPQNPGFLPRWNEIVENARAAIEKAEKGI